MKSGMFSHATHLKISSALFAALVAVGLGGNLLASSGLFEDPRVLQAPVRVLIFSLFVGFAFAVAPVMIGSVLGLRRPVDQSQIDAMTGGVGAEKLTVWVVWSLMALAVAVALPAMVARGVFD